MSAECLEKLDYLLLLFAKTESNIQINVADNDNIWLNMCRLPETMRDIRLTKMNDTYIIIGSEITDNCYIYNHKNDRFESINLENKFPTNIKYGYSFNSHLIIDITNDDDNNDKIYNKRIYLLMGNNFESNYMYQCIYDINTNSMRFIDITNKMVVSDNDEIGSPKSIAVTMQNYDRVIIMTDYGAQNVVLFIYDYIEHKYAKYRMDNVIHDIYNDDNEFQLDGFVQLKDKNKFILWSYNTFYQLIINENTDINKYTFNYSQLSSITDNKNIILPKKFSCLISWHGFGHVLFNDFLICFGGLVDNEMTNECEAIHEIHLFDINNNIWYQGDRESYLIPNLNYDTNAILSYYKDQYIIDILGGMRDIGSMNGLSHQHIDNNHYRLNLGYSNKGKRKIWKIFTEQNHKLLSHQIWRIVFDFMDYGFMSHLLNNFKPY